MFQFPAATLEPGGIAIIANNKTRFNANYPGVAAKPNVAVYGVAEGDVTKYSTWAGGNIITMLDGPSAAATSFQEEAVLLDGSDSIVDIATYISSVFPNAAIQPGVVPITFLGNLLPESRSYERCPASRDTNDASFDFIAHEGKAAQTPGVICEGKTALSLTQFAPATVAIGGKIDYTLSYSNSGASTVDVYITDTLPLNTSYVGGSQIATPIFGTSPIVFTDLGGGKLQWKLPRVTSGTGTISFSVQVANNVQVDQELINTAVIAGPLGDTDPADNTATATTTVTSTSQADVGISKALISPPATFYTGRLAMYTLTYSNSGDLPALNTLITDTIPPGLAFVDANMRPASSDSSTVVFDVGTVSSAVNQTIVMTFTVTAPTVGGRSIVNSASIGTATTPEFNTANNTASATNVTVAVPPRDLTLALAANTNTVPFGGALVYSLTISNIGGGTASGIQVVDTLPDGLVYQPGSSGAAGEPSISANRRTLTWNLPVGFVVETGATRVLQFTAIAQARPGSAVVNNAVVNLSGEANTQNNATSSEATTVTGSTVLLPLILK